MKQLPLGALLSSSASVLLLGISLEPSARAQGWEIAQNNICSTDGDYEPASSTYRTVQLPDFGIEVDIPENYRTMRRQDGSVEILHPDDFEVFQCIARGGRGASGYYSQEIHLVDRDSSMSLREQAIWSVGYQIEANGNRIPAATQVLDYNQGALSGYIVTSDLGYSAVFMGIAPNAEDKVLKVFASCDCEVEVEEVTDLLSRIRVLD